MHGKKRRLKGSLWGIKVEAISHLKGGGGGCCHRKQPEAFCHLLKIIITTVGRRLEITLKTRINCTS